MTKIKEYLTEEELQNFKKTEKDGRTDTEFVITKIERK